MGDRRPAQEVRREALQPDSFTSIPTRAPGRRSSSSSSSSTVGAKKSPADRRAKKDAWASVPATSPGAKGFCAGRVIAGDRSTTGAALAEDDAALWTVPKLDERPRLQEARWDVVRGKHRGDTSDS